MKIEIDWGNPVFGEEQLTQLTAGDLNDFYVSATDFDKTNLFFILLNSLHHYEEYGTAEQAAYVSFLAAYYLFVPPTPPGSCALALHYIQKAIALDPKPEYQKWYELMLKGN